jgi:hypothetical protein
MVKEHQKREEVGGRLGGITGRGKKLPERSPGSFFAAIINLQCD